MIEKFQPEEYVKSLFSSDLGIGCCSFTGNRFIPSLTGSIRNNISRPIIDAMNPIRIEITGNNTLRTIDLTRDNALFLILWSISPEGGRRLAW
jgi:hypothetical protein